MTEFRTGMIVGSGSALFEMIRYLTEREPVLICPAWFFSSRGLRGFLYWYLIHPFHVIGFHSLIQKIVGQSET